MCILLFTCLNTRTIHLEVVHSMSLENFMLAFIRFHNRFNVPRVIYAYNVKTFTSSASLLTDIIASNGFYQKYINFNIEIKHIPACFPWYAASWKRMIKTVKQCLYKSIGRQCMREIKADHLVGCCTGSTKFMAKHILTWFSTKKQRKLKIYCSSL